MPAWASIQRTIELVASASPAMPITPWAVTSTPTGTSGTFQRYRRCGSSRAGSSSSMSEGWSTVPTRSTRKSGSTRRRSQSRLLGPVAIRPTSAGSGAAEQRAIRSSLMLAKAAFSASFRRRRYSALSLRYFLPPLRRS